MNLTILIYFLTVGPAETETASVVCGVDLTIPLFNKNAYVFYLGVSVNYEELAWYWGNID